jgi:hypothetical protein
MYLPDGGNPTSTLTSCSTIKATRRDTNAQKLEKNDNRMASLRRDGRGKMWSRSRPKTLQLTEIKKKMMKIISKKSHGKFLILPSVIGLQNKISDRNILHTNQPDDGGSKEL